MTRGTPELPRPFSENALKAIFKVRAGNPFIILSRENNRLEFRETFSLNACKDKLRTFAAFANNQGGYLVFGVKDRPRQLMGLAGRSFTDLETERLTGMLNEHFAPEIHWEAHEYDFGGRLFGLIHVREADRKPVVCLKNFDQAKCKEGDIYYRYRGRSEAIKYPELRDLLDELRARERDLWMKHLSRIASAGVQNAAVLDSVTGEVTGSSGSFIIDESLLPKIAFIREGHFTESKGAPALKLIGDVEVIDSHLVQPTKQVVRRTRGINFPDIVTAFLDQEDVPDPAEYISAICYQTSASLPIFFYMVKAGLSRQGVVKLIESSKSTSAARTYLRRRMEASPRQYGGSLSYSPVIAECRTMLIAKSLPEEPDAVTLRDSLSAVQTLDRSELDVAYLLPLLKRWFESYYAGVDSATKAGFRRAICHLDELLFEPLVIAESTLEA